jgi:Protein of unknown function DUF2617
VLFVRPRIAELGLHLLQRSVHPELLETCAVRQFEREHYVLQTSITTAGHAIVFHLGDLVLTEVCAGLDQDLPQFGRLVTQTLDAGQCDERLIGDRLLWSSRFQLENVAAAVFVTIQQQLDEQGECEGLVHRFRPGSASRAAVGGVSYVNFQAFARHAIVRAFHTFPDTLTVCKTESRFTLVDGK